MLDVLRLGSAFRIVSFLAASLVRRPHVKSGCLDLWHRFPDAFGCHIGAAVIHPVEFSGEGYSQTNFCSSIHARAKRVPGFTLEH